MLRSMLSGVSDCFSPTKMDVIGNNKHVNTVDSRLVGLPSKRCITRP